MYICSNLLPFSTSTSVSFYFIFKMFKYVSFKKRKKGGIYCSQDKWESSLLLHSIQFLIAILQQLADGMELILEGVKT